MKYHVWFTTLIFYESAVWQKVTNLFSQSWQNCFWKFLIQDIEMMGNAWFLLSQVHTGLWLVRTLISWNCLHISVVSKRVDGTSCHCCVCSFVFFAYTAAAQTDGLWSWAALAVWRCPPAVPGVVGQPWWCHQQTIHWNRCLEGDHHYFNPVWSDKYPGQTIIL